MKKYADLEITSLEKNEVFVFGSNLGGKHAGGAAKLAHERFGAEWGVGKGMTGKCYALPTLDENFQLLDKYEQIQQIAEFYYVALKYPHHTFLLTKVGCGIAGWDEYEMMCLFEDALRPILTRKQPAPQNILFPRGWYNPLLAYRPGSVNDIYRTK